MLVYKERTNSDVDESVAGKLLGKMKRYELDGFPSNDRKSPPSPEKHFSRRESCAILVHAVKDAQSTGGQLSSNTSFF